MAEKKPAAPASVSKTYLRSYASAFIYWVCKIGSLTYRGALHYFTLDPIAGIQKCQHTKDGLPRLLYEFRSRKVEESTFVRNAAAISAAAVIGVFSWPSVEQSFWLAKMFWHWSLIASFFSLVSSVQQRLLREFPQDVPTPSALDDVYTQQVMKACMSLVLSCNRMDDQGRYQASLQMIWIWQSSTMLMSYAWLLFFLGYALHILSPIFETLEGDWSRMTIPVS
ncbi:hypothetical protein B0I35DRAFT_404934 [Stachybotrys elegans]|uniref:Uncharacterized protein n=1 Tax=Stachybotrys elegans TaxID=80388 RepID=A0A8K0T0A5_9HYPO|nr:hypothetical protein B0I35DRAFT_404934 [Stachybotrys elegans]